MIKQIDFSTMILQFKDLIQEIEYGDHFDSKNFEHELIFEEKLKILNLKNYHIYGFYNSENIPCRLISMCENNNLFFENDCEIMQIGTKKEFRRKGIGKEMLDFISDYAKRKQFYCIFAKTYAADYETIYFYGKNGFVPISVIPETNGRNDEGSIIMRKRVKT